MTKEEELDWLYRLRSEIFVYMPKEWLIPMKNALDKVIKALEQETTTRNCFGCKYSKDNHRTGTEECHLCMWENQYTSTSKNNLALIRTDGLDEEIRCTMCTNSMKSDRGCDGNCVVNKDMYKAVMDAIEKRIQPATKNDKVDCEHTDCNNCVNHKYCDYETTPKNNLGIDAVSRQAVDRLVLEFIRKTTDESIAFYEHFLELPSVTPQLSSELEKNSKKLEKDFGELDCISREQAKVAIRDKFKDLPSRVEINTILNELPSVTSQEPKTGHCRDCKWWKDSDGEYRRGCGAESQCPINRKEVYEGNGFCFLYEPQESEE